MYRYLKPDEKIQEGDEYKAYWNEAWLKCRDSIGSPVYLLGTSISVRRKDDTTTVEEVKHLIKVLEL